MIACPRLSSYLIVSKSPFFEALKSVFSSYIFIQEKITHDSVLNFASDLMVVTDTDIEKMQIIEAIVSGSENQGIIAIWIYGKDLNLMKTKLQKEILPKLNQMVEGIKEGPELIPMYCAGNCGELLNIEEMNDKGIIKCPACETLNMIPSRLRIH